MHLADVHGVFELHYTDPQGLNLPVDYRIYDPAEGKTKNDYFREMLAEVLAWGLRPAFATGDGGYSGGDNLKTVKNHRMGFLFGVESNRLVSIERGAWTQVARLDIPGGGVRVWLRGLGEVKLFRTWLKDQPRHDVVFLPDGDAHEAFGAADFDRLRERHWRIECYHRTIKQVCNIERFQVRTRTPILNHVFAALCGYVHLQQMRFDDLIRNAYQWRRDLYKEVVAAFVSGFMDGKEHLNPQFKAAVKA